MWSPSGLPRKPTASIRSRTPLCALFARFVGFALVSNRAGWPVKLLPQYTGPYKVLREATPVTYEIAPAASSFSSTPRNSEIIHVTHLKQYHSPTDVQMRRYGAFTDGSSTSRLPLCKLSMHVCIRRMKVACCSSDEPDWPVLQPLLQIYFANIVGIYNTLLHYLYITIITWCSSSSSLVHITLESVLCLEVTVFGHVYQA